MVYVDLHLTRAHLMKNGTNAELRCLSGLLKESDEGRVTIERVETKCLTTEFITAVDARSGLKGLIAPAWARSRDKILFPAR